MCARIASAVLGVAVRMHLVYGPEMNLRQAQVLTRRRLEATVAIVDGAVNLWVQKQYLLQRLCCDEVVLRFVLAEHRQYMRPDLGSATMNHPWP